MKYRFGIFTAILIMTVSIYPVYSQSGWEQLDSGTTTTLRAVHFIDTETGFIAGEGGTILKTVDAGATWEDVSVFTNDLYDIYFFSPDSGIAVGTEGLIIRTTDGGNNWSVISGGVTVDFLSVSFSGSTGIIGGHEQTVLTSDDAGANWEIYQTGFMGFGLRGAHMLDENYGYLSGQNAIFQPFIFITDDGGESWSFSGFYFEDNGVLNEGMAFDVHFIDENTGMVAGQLWDGRGGIVRTQNAGGSWTSAGIFSQGLHAIHFPTYFTGFAAGASGSILVTDDGGASWNPQVSDTSVPLYDIFFADSLNGYTVGGNGVILKTTTGGEIDAVPDQVVLSYPENSQTVEVDTDEMTLVMGWYESQPQVTNYQLDVARDAGFNDMVITDDALADTFYVFTGMEDNETYFWRVRAENEIGWGEYSDVWSFTTLLVGVSDRQIPAEYTLLQNYPNPFNPSTVIRYGLPSGSIVKLEIYNSLGQKITTLVEGELEAGYHETEWYAGRVTSGVYFYRFEAVSTDNSSEHFVKIKSMVVLK